MSWRSGGGGGRGDHTSQVYMAKNQDPNENQKCSNNYLIVYL